MEEKEAQPAPEWKLVTISLEEGKVNKISMTGIIDMRELMKFMKNQMEENNKMGEEIKKG